MNQTTNYQLNQWDPDDKVLRSDFNADNAKLDAALAGLAAEVASQSASLAHKGNCLLYTTTYVGDGSAGAAHPKSFTFPHRPLAVFVVGGRIQLTALRNSTYSIGSGGGSNILMCQLSWTENGISWYYPREDAEVQCNQSGTSYLLVALLDGEM